MEVRPTQIPDVKLLVLRKHGDNRGFFSETYNRRDFAALGIGLEFVQDNQALSGPAGTVRGLHYQLAPAAQSKLVRVTRGRIFDVAVDIRRGSPSFGKFASSELSAEEWNQLYIPAGFAHGYCTLTADTEVIYKVSAYYTPAHERAIRWNDPAIGIPWPIGEEAAIISDRDRRSPLLARQPDLF
ncbi:MAG: dTDP-4-dehydrorhamnose 3,5-epimerase [Dongiaceae bacterium]